MKSIEKSPPDAESCCPVANRTAAEIQAEYHGIRGLDATAFGGATLLFLAAMLLASGIPALRASRLDPVEILKDS